MMPGFFPLVLLIFSGCLALQPPPVFGDEPTIQQAVEHRELVRKVLDQWQARQHQVRTLKIVVVGQWVCAKGSLDDGNPKIDLVVPLKQTWYFELVKGWYRRDTVSSTIGIDGNTLHPSSDIFVYDGATYRRFRPPAENRRDGESGQSISLVDYGAEIDVSSEFTIEALPILFSVGYVSWIDQGFGRTPEIPYDPRDYEVLESASRPDNLVTLLRRASSATRNDQVEYLVDPQKDGAILKYKTSRAGNGLTFGFRGITIETEFAEIESLWFPSKWQASFGEDAGSFAGTSLEVEEIKFNLDLERKFFQISDDVLQPGLLVVDNEAPYTVAADGNTLHSGFATDRGSVPTGERSSLRTGLVLLNILGLLAVAVYLGWRKRRKNASP